MEAINEVFTESGILKVIINMDDEYEKLSKLSELWDEEQIKSEPTISQIKNDIKHCKNPIELKKLNRQLNELYKTRRMMKKHKTKIER